MNYFLLNNDLNINMLIKNNINYKYNILKQFSFTMCYK